MSIASTNKENFKDYLQGRKLTYPSSLDTIAMSNILKSIDPNYSNIYECNDITVLNSVLAGLNSKANPNVIQALKYGHNACRPALKDYIQFISKGMPSVVASVLPSGISTTPSPIKYNGLATLWSLAGGQSKLLDHIIEYSLFIKPKSVVSEIKVMGVKGLLSGTPGGQILPVRYSSKMEYYDRSKKPLLGKGKGRDTARKCTGIYNYCEQGHPLMNRGCVIEIDKTGNYSNVFKIKKYTGLTVSSGKKSSIQYYMISHIWGETYDPLFFSSLWNIVITPLHCSPILDKEGSIDPATNSFIILCNEMMKAICYLLYIKPNFTPAEITDLFKNVKDPRTIDKSILAKAQNYITSNAIHFI